MGYFKTMDTESTHTKEQLGVDAPAEQRLDMAVFDSMKSVMEDEFAELIEAFYLSTEEVFASMDAAPAALEEDLEPQRKKTKLRIKMSAAPAPRAPREWIAPDADTVAGKYFASIAELEALDAGAMLTVISETMLPESFAKGGSVVGLSTILGFLAIIILFVWLVG